MTFASGALGLIIGLGPRAVTDGTAGKFVKGLAEELWAGLAEVDAGLFFALFAALFSAGDAHRSNSDKIQRFLGRLRAVAVGAEGP